MAEAGIISDKGKKIFKRILIGVFFTYVLLVGAFETWLGISQPENNQTITITTTNDAGENTIESFREFTTRVLCM